MFVLKLSRQTRAPADAAVGAGHVHDRRARFGCLEAIGLRDHVGDLITAPTVSLDTDVVLVKAPSIDDGSNGRLYALQSITAGIASLVNVVRHENQTAVAHVVSWFDRS